LTVTWSREGRRELSRGSSNGQASGTSGSRIPRKHVDGRERSFGFRVLGL